MSRVRSEQFRRFEYSTALTPTAKQSLRTELQKDIEEWEAKGNRIPEAPPLITKPRPERKSQQQSSVTSIHRIRWTDAEVQRVRELKAQGLTHMQVAMRISEQFGIKRSRGSVESLCHLRGIAGLFVKAKKRVPKCST